MSNEVVGRKRKIFTFAVALFGALLLWMYAIGYDTEMASETYNGVVVEITGVNTNGYTVADGDSFSLSVDVRLAGTRQLLSDVEAADLSAYVDISGVTGPGLTTLPVTIVAPNGATVESVSVPNVTLYVDVFTSRTIKVDVENTYSSPYTIGQIKQDAYVVTVYGPESIINNLEAYAHFDLGTVVTGSFTVSGNIQLRDVVTKAPVSNPYVTLSRNTLNVTVTMHGKKTVPVKLNMANTGYTESEVTFVSNISAITLEGPVYDLNKVDSITVACGESISGGEYQGSVTLTELLATNNVPGTLSVPNGGDVLTYTVTLPDVSFAEVEVSADRIIIYGIPADSTVFAEATAGITVRILGTYQDVLDYQSSLMTVMVNYNTMKEDPGTGEYIGIAEISTGDNHVCVVGQDYTVPVSVTLQVINVIS